MQTTISRSLSRDGINWISLAVFSIFHLGAVAALFYFSWPAVFTVVGLY